MLDSEGRLSEGTVSNVFLARGGEIWTPSASCGILCGVTRHLVLRLMSDMGITWREAELTRADIYQADEVFLTNTSVEILPVIRCDERIIGKGIPGPLTRKIHRSYRKLMQAEEEIS